MFLGDCLMLARFGQAFRIPVPKVQISDFLPINYSLASDARVQVVQGTLIDTTICGKHLGKAGGGPSSAERDRSDDVVEVTTQISNALILPASSFAPPLRAKTLPFYSPCLSQEREFHEPKWQRTTKQDREGHSRTEAESFPTRPTKTSYFRWRFEYFEDFTMTEDPKEMARL